MALTDKLKAIADSIRGKLGTTDAMTLDEMPNKISSIETGPSIQESKTIEITSNGTTEVTPDDGYGGIKKVDVSVAVPEPPAPEPLAHDKTVTITANGTTEVIPDDGYEFLTRVTVNTNVPIPTGPNITITELSTTETVVALSYGGLVLLEFSEYGGDATKQFMENAFEKIIFSVDVDGFPPNIPVGYNLDEAATLLLNMGKFSAPIGAIFRGAPGEILVKFNESGSISIDIMPEAIETITQQTTAYIRKALGSDTIGVTCHDYIHVNMMDLGD